MKRFLLSIWAKELLLGNWVWVWQFLIWKELLDLWSFYFSVFPAQKTADVSQMKYDCLLSFTLWVFFLFLLSHERLVVVRIQLQPWSFPPHNHHISMPDYFILPGKQFHFNILTPSKAEDDGFETIFMYVMRKSTFEPAWKSGSVGVWGVHNF